MWATLSVILLIVNAIWAYFLWRSDKDCDEAEKEAARVCEAAESDQKRHADEYQQALDEIVRLDANVAHLKAELDEANTSADHWQQRYEQVDEIRANLAKALGARTNGHQITLGNGDAKIVHGVASLSSDLKCLPDGFIRRKLGSVRLTDTLLLWNGEKKQMQDVELTDDLVVVSDVDTFAKRMSELTKDGVI